MRTTIDTEEHGTLDDVKALLRRYEKYRVNIWHEVVNISVQVDGTYHFTSKVLLSIIKSLKILKNPTSRKTDNQWPKEKGQKLICKTLQRKKKIEQHKPN